MKRQRSLGMTAAALVSALLVCAGARAQDPEMSVEVLVVAGGGGGGSNGGGGGAGGLIHSNVYPVVYGPVSITVGNKGAGAASGVGGNGQNSVFGGLVAIGGGGGGSGGTAARSGGTGIVIVRPLYHSSARGVGGGDADSCDASGTGFADRGAD